MKLAPPRVFDAERRLAPFQRAALDDYVALERRLQRVASGSCAPICAACRNPCCRAAFCEESWTSPWLRAATSRPGAVREVEAERAIEGHLAADGCRLRFGRPPVCYEFACSKILMGLSGDEEKYLFRVISHVMTFAGEEALAGTHLVEIDDLAKLDEERTARLRARIALAGRIFEAAARALEAVREGRRGERADWDLVTRHFSTRGYRLSRPEAPDSCGGRNGGKKRMRTLPIVGALLLFGLAIAVPIAGCGAPPRRLELDAPKPVERGVFCDDDVQFRFQGSGEGLEVEVLNRSGKRLAIPWWKARFVGVDGAEREVVAWRGTPTKEILDEAQAVLELGPGESWRGNVHPRDRLRSLGGGPGARVAVLPLLAAEEAVPGRRVGLDVEIEVGRRPERLEFRFTVTPVDGAS
jgi:hypothetical protein